MSEALEPPHSEAEQPPEEAGGGFSQLLHQQAYKLALAAILLLMVVVFSPTPFAGLHGSEILGIEPSSILFIVPHFFFVASLWCQGEVRLWNSLSEFGCP